MSLLVPFYGYCEVDTMISRQSALLLAVALERYSRHPKHLPKSIIYDNGSEDVEHMLINKILSTH